MPYTPQGKLIKKVAGIVVDKITEEISSELAKVSKALPKEKRKLSRKAGKIIARRLGLKPIKDQQIILKHQITDQIILLVKQKGLTHQQVAWTVCASRSKITRMINKNPKYISLEFVIRVASALGIKINLVF